MLLFLVGVTVVTAIGWRVADLPMAKAAVFFLSMLFGGSIYFLLSTRH
jgi:hypothetical protein